MPLICSPRFEPQLELCTTFGELSILKRCKDRSYFHSPPIRTNANYEHTKMLFLDLPTTGSARCSSNAADHIHRYIPYSSSLAPTCLFVRLRLSCRPVGRRQISLQFAHLRQKCHGLGSLFFLNQSGVCVGGWCKHQCTGTSARS